MRQLNHRLSAAHKVGVAESKPFRIKDGQGLQLSSFNAIADALRVQGNEVENPADHGVVEDADWVDYLAYDLTRLGFCDAIVLLPGRENSKGARLKVLIGDRLDMTVVNAHDLVAP